MNDHKIEEGLRKLASIDRSAARSAWALFLGSEQSEKDEVEGLVDILLDRKIAKNYEKQIRLEPPPPETCKGRYQIGKVCYPHKTMFCEFGLRENEWIKHLLIVGMTGAGKTTLMFCVLSELAKSQKPFLVFDWKQNYRDLIQRPEFGQLRIYTIARPTRPFNFNPLLPPNGTHPGEWLMKLVDVIKHAYFVGEGVEYLLRNAIDQVYRRCGVLDGETKLTPNFEMVKTHILALRLQGRMSLWKASTMRVLDALCFSHGLGSVINCKSNNDLETALQQMAVLELDALADSDKIFLTEAIILWIYEHRKKQADREHFKHALIIEEGHHILSQAKEKTEGAETIMETCLRQIREFGEAVLVIDQEPTKLSNSIKANTYTKICFALGNGKDALEMSNCMGLDKEEADYLNLLEVGYAIVSLKGRIHQPLHIRFSKIDINKGEITDHKLTQHQR